MITSQFKFSLGDKICDKEVLDVRLVVGRVLDVDDHNKELYILKNNSGMIDWMGAEAVHDYFDIYKG